MYGHKLLTAHTFALTAYMDVPLPRNPWHPTSQDAPTCMSFALSSARRNINLSCHSRVDVSARA